MLKRIDKVKQNSLAQTCAGAVAEYMSRLSDRDLIHLRESFSQRTSMEWYADWGTASASEMAARVLDSDARFYTLSPDQIMFLGWGARRVCYRLLLEGFSEADKAALYAREPDSHSRLLIAKQLLSGELSESMWERLLHGKSAPIRYLALQAKHRSWVHIMDNTGNFQSLEEHT